MRPPIRLTVTILVLIGLVLAQVGCTRRDGETGDEGAQPAPAESPGGEGLPMRVTRAGRERQAETPGESRSAAGSSADAEVRGADPIAADVAIDPRDEAFAAHRLAATPRYPADFVIGSLRTSGLARLESAARAYARSFLATLLKEGEPPEDAFLEPAPGARAVVDDLVASALPADGLRVGRPLVLAGGEMSVPYRVLGAELSAQGEVILELADGQWYTSDIQVVTSSPGVDAQFDPARDSPRW
ncbi:MAG: hypothetical protein ACOC0E_12505 [Spirochaetota bacterium]